MTYTSDFTEASITEKILTNGTYYIFYRTKVSTATTSTVGALQVRITDFLQLTSPAESYSIIVPKLGVGVVTVNVTFTNSRETSTNLLKGLNNENFVLQTYVVPGK